MRREFFCAAVGDHRLPIRLRQRKTGNFSKKMGNFRPEVPRFFANLPHISLPIAPRQTEYGAISLFSRRKTRYYSIKVNKCAK